MRCGADPLRRDGTCSDPQDQEGDTAQVSHRRQDSHRDGRGARSSVGGRSYAAAKGIHPTIYYKGLKDFMEAGKALFG